MKRNTTLRRDLTAHKLHTADRVSARAFTLVELLVVIAITSILLALLFGPIISSFNLTRRARAVAQAQDAARFGLERLTRELGRATYIYDNGLSPVAIPMAYAGVTSQNGTFDIGNPADPYNPATWPAVAYGRIDLAQPAVRQDGTDIIDPTTGEPVGGAELRPGVRGKRVTRYFLALRYPGINPDNGNQRLYQNRYEFRRVDNDNNPVILYRAEYDPTDPNLFDRDAADYASTAANSGGFNDPAFFYATKLSDTGQTDADGNAANGRSYGENWQRIAQPVLVSENVDLLRWNRAGAATNRDQKDANDPFTTTTNFAPVAVPGDIATANFLTSGGVETPAAVPTSYQTKYAAWTYPYTITILRGSTNFSGGTPSATDPFGYLKLTVDREPDGDIFIANTLESTGTLAATTANIYTVYSPLTRKLFVKTPRLTFAIDADRGRIETAFPPLLGASAGGVGVPYYQPATGAPVAVAPGLFPVAGEVVETRFKIDTRALDAGTGAVAANQGIVQTDLFAASYQLADSLITAPATLASPLDVFGETSGAARARGVRIVVGSERLSAPVADQGVETSWTRLRAVRTALQPPAQYSATPTPIFTLVPERLPQYVFDYDFYPVASNAPYEQIFRFDEPGSVAAGMAAATTNGQNFLTATYFWQNNYSRNSDPADAYWGSPLSATRARIESGGATRPEADIFRIDYATRQQYIINLGARIYDPTDGRAQTIQVSDKVIINNVLR